MIRLEPLAQADITYAVAMQQAREDMDAVVHLAGEARGLSESDVETFRDNALSTFVAINAAQQCVRSKP